ncbi:hypothetical protein SUGI_0844460 [Cryptomeria japonica]|nr:hypothetical protein SUGI_0844420 [Cryptomeria japonica]GLJ40827.1 hypothetical protein SUGI_0844440 [Cryptomeria japonica]GLJ40829.1 hypothetical protein SUGI_0844460 [Cryptomeria japonica]
MAIMVNFILAGWQSSSVVLSWFFWLLLYNPHVEEHILAEIRSVLSKTFFEWSTNDSRIKWFPEYREPEFYSRRAEADVLFKYDVVRISLILPLQSV